MVHFAREAKTHLPLFDRFGAGNGPVRSLASNESMSIVLSDCLFRSERSFGISRDELVLGRNFENSNWACVSRRCVRTVSHQLAIADVQTRNLGRCGISGDLRGYRSIRKSADLEQHGRLDVDRH